MLIYGKGKKYTLCGLLCGSTTHEGICSKLPNRSASKSVLMVFSRKSKYRYQLQLWGLPTAKERAYMTFSLKSLQFIFHRLLVEIHHLSCWEHVNEFFPRTDSILSPPFHWHNQGCAQTVCNALPPVMLVVGTLTALWCDVLRRCKSLCAQWN